MPICNPIKCTAALLQSSYDSLQPRGTDRKSGTARVCPYLKESVCVVTNTSNIVCYVCATHWYQRSERVNEKVA